MHKMKTRQLVALFLFAAAFSNQVFAQWFVRPSAGYAVFQDSKYSDEMVAGFAVGGAIGQDRSHELSLDYDHLNWKYRDTGHVQRLQGADTSGDGRLQSIMLSYRFYTGLSGDRYRFFIGPALGFSSINGDMGQSFSGRLPSREILTPGRPPLAERRE